MIERKVCKLLVFSVLQCELRRCFWGRGPGRGRLFLIKGSFYRGLERRVFGRLLGPYAGYFQRSPRFNDQKLRALTGLACPPTGKDFFRTLVDYCIDVGFLGAKAKV